MHIEDILRAINDKTKEYISRISSKELCFNIYGKNEKIIDLVRKLHFKSDMEGYHLEYTGRELPQMKKII
ncbi:hypothetical protein ACF3M2_08960 [Tissierella carlieri]|jgi:hypothetical protein|uniref:hypothetical protein n=1 Tax=Tissierella TaxID=41273 RepID=UPI002805BF19|nr:hypothetical protein [uncultured Tissierella sp.]MDU5080840.1 hypothetical protein [Bacillota bacterium]